MLRFATRNRWLFVLGAAVLFAPAGTADDTGTTVRRDSLPSFGGRSGATKVKLIVIGCGVPESAEVRRPAQVHEADAVGKPNSVNEKRLRELADGGSSDWLAKPPKSKEEILKQLPPKYRELVKEYFEKLEMAQKEKK
jgi:hypothetical protein